MGSKAELVFIPAPGVGHVMSTVEIAKLLVSRDQRLSITVFIIDLPSDMFKNSTYSNLLANFASSEQINFIKLPQVQIDPSINPMSILQSLVDLQKPNVKESLSNFIAQPNSPKLAGFVIDMFCTPMIDVANEFNVPTYLFYTSNAGLLNLTMHFLNLRDVHNKDTTEYKNSDEELIIPGYVNPVPAKVLPGFVIEAYGAPLFNHARRYKDVKGIMVNTFMDLESTPIEALSNGGTSPLYPVGPILSLSNKSPDGSTQSSDILKWLDKQPRGSVVFLCFGSMGSVSDEQIKEIAIALEKCGCRFLWSVRKSPPNGKFGMPSDHNDLSDVLPEGFLDRTAEIGKLIGWAPQSAVLAHPSLGGFVSHCGWNSTLESIWFGVPIATWPLYAEQQTNAFYLVKEMGMAVEIKMDYRKDFMSEEQMIIRADEIERGIRSLLEIDVEKVQKVRDMSQKSKKALEEGGSSYVYLGKFIDDVFKNVITG